MPVGRLWGVGPKTQARLAARAIDTIGQIAALSDEALYALFGRSGPSVRDLARGIDARAVTPGRETRSVSSEETYEYDLHDDADMRAAVRELAVDVSRRLRAHELRGSTIGVKVKLSNFTIVGRQTTLADATDDASAIAAAALWCLERVPLDGRGVRLLGVRVASITEEPARQISFFGSARE
jgi:DNA polymerase-4